MIKREELIFNLWQLNISCHIQQLIFSSSNLIFSFIWTREDKTIESAVPFPAPEKGDNRGLSPFHPRMIIVVGECPLLSPVWKSSPLPRKPLKCLENLPPSPSPVTGAGTGKGTPSFNALKEPNFHYFINLTWPTFTAASTVQFAVVILLEKTRFQDIKVYFCLKNAKKKRTGGNRG